MKSVTGTIYIISAASGTGKTTLTKELFGSVQHMRISISHTTRSLRPGEKPNESYFFVDVPKFEQMITENAFLEHANVFGDYYGTSQQWVEEQLHTGNDVILDIDWQGAAQIRKKLKCVSIFLLPPSLQELRNRLEKRKRDSAAVIEQRLIAARNEILHYNEFDYIVINDRFDEALSDLQAIVRAQRLGQKFQAEHHAELIAELLETNA